VTDNRIKDRVKGLLTPPSNESPAASEFASLGEASQQALQVLTLAQRTADDHLASAKEEAAKIHANAMAAAEQTAREAEMHAHKVRQEADKALVEARATAARMAQEAKAQADEARRTSDKILSDAQAKAEMIAADARAGADELKIQADQRYHDVVGSLEGKREALQQQIEALERFDHDYRARLTAFMQNQLRALWVDQPRVTGDEETADGEPAVPAQRRSPVTTTGSRTAPKAG
jgi:cell division septum initiation protein DivIVA